MKNFYTQFFSEIFISLPNDYVDNYDYYRFGKLPSPQKKFFLKSVVEQYLKNKGYVHSQEMYKAIKFLDPYANQFNTLYDILADQYSKNLLVKILAYRCLGQRKVKLPLSNTDYWKQIIKIDSSKDVNEYIEVTHPVGKILLYKYNLKDNFAPIEIFLTPVGVHTKFILKQYEYNSPEKTIKAEKDDVVIDAGTCWGDTALYFANEVGEKGMVYSFEFVPNNINVFKRNLSLNPHLKSRIKMIQRPLSDVSHNSYYFKDTGPGSKIDAKQFEGYDGIVTSISIDNFVEKYNLTSVDYIKMDIEGAEPIALKGAIESIKKFKPKLAISIYHRTGKHGMDDFVNIPAYINNLNLGYKLYLDHYTIHNEETVLFAISDD